MSLFKEAYFCEKFKTIKNNHEKTLTKSFAYNGDFNYRCSKYG